MNKVELIGRFTADPEIRYTNGEPRHTIASFTLAVDRKVARNNGETSADFIRCQAWDKRAELIEKYFSKGNKIGISGRIQTGSYEDKDGHKVYTTDIVVEEIDFCESKNSGSNESAPAAQTAQNDGFMNIPDGFDAEMPFA